MSSARSQHSATLLNDGRVLIVGGDAPDFGTAEIFDPFTGRVVATTNMLTQHGSGHAAVLLASGRVLVAGGVSPVTNITTAAAELFIPPTWLVFQPSWNLAGNSWTNAINLAATFGSQDAKVAGVTDNIVTVWKWDAVSLRWQFYSPQLTVAGINSYAASKGYDVLTTINPMEGYWVNALSAVTLPGQSGAAVAFGFSDFAALPSGFSLITLGSEMTPTAFNNSVAQLIPLSPGTPMSANFTSLWAWEETLQKWYFYSPLLEASGGLAAVKNYAHSQNFLHFQDYSKKLDIGVGFWVNK